MIIRIRKNAFFNTDSYVHFNRKIGFNSETREGGNQVLVSYRNGGVGYGASTLVPKLNGNGFCTITGIGGTITEDSVTTTVNSIDTSSIPAKGQIFLFSWAPVVPPSERPVVVPTTDNQCRAMMMPTPNSLSKRPQKRTCRWDR